PAPPERTMGTVTEPSDRSVAAPRSRVAPDAAACDTVQNKEIKAISRLNLILPPVMLSIELGLPASQSQEGVDDLLHLGDGDAHAFVEVHVVLHLLHAEEHVDRALYLGDAHPVVPVAVPRFGDDVHVAGSPGKGDG